MSGRTLVLGSVAALATGSLLSRRGSPARAVLDPAIEARLGGERMFGALTTRAIRQSGACGEDATLYHVTSRKNLGAILAHGLESPDARVERQHPARPGVTDAEVWETWAARQRAVKAGGSYGEDFVRRSRGKIFVSMGREAMLGWAESLDDNGQRDLVAIRIDPASGVADAMKPDTKGYSTHPCSFFLARKRVTPRFLSHDEEGTAAITAKLRELREREEAAWRRWHDDDGSVRETPRTGSASRLVYKQKTLDHEVTGVVYDDPVAAFDAVAWKMFDQSYWQFLAVDEDDPGCDAVARRIVAYLWKKWHGLGPGDRVFAWDTLYVQPDRRGRGFGRATVARIEDMLRADGIRAVILQAGHIDVGSSSSQAFWEKMGYAVWPGHYEDYDDRIMVKVLA